MGLGQACLILDQPQQAESAFQALQRLGSTNPYLPLYAAYVQLKSGQSEEARRRLEQVLLKHPERPMAMANDAWLLATHPDPKARNGRLAVLRAEVACAAVAEKPQPRLLDALAAAHAELGQFPEAIAAARKAEALANAAGDKGLAEEIHARLQLYLTNQPFHQTSAETDRH